MPMPLDLDDPRSDDALLALYGRGDGAAARILALRLTPLAVRVGEQMLGDAAEAEEQAT